MVRHDRLDAYKTFRLEEEDNPEEEDEWEEGRELGEEKISQRFRAPVDTTPNLIKPATMLMRDSFFVVNLVSRRSNDLR